MQLWVGLGNPGASYAMQRHNVGFMAADAIADVHRFDPWRVRFQGWAAEGRIAGEKIILLKPATFMNESGRSVGEALRFYKLAVGDVTIFHDELDPLADLLGAIASEAEWLAKGDDVRFMNDIALRLAS